MKIYTLPLLLCLCTLAMLSASAQSSTQTRYIIRLKDKGNSPYTLANPSAYLSPRSLARRTRYGIAVDNTDLPVTPSYIQSIEDVPNVTVLNASRWMNQVSIQVSDAASVPAALATINSFSFVQSSAPTAARVMGPEREDNKKLEEGFTLSAARTAEVQDNYFNYGQSAPQVNIHNGAFLHNIGLRGQGMILGMLDAGYTNYRTVSGFDSARTNGQILDTWDFVLRNPDVNNYSGHGTACFSAIAANLPGQLVGTAPKANYFLYLDELKPEWTQRVGDSLQEKLAYLGRKDEWQNIFPWQYELSEQIEAYPFSASFLQQPHLYLRLRPGKEKPVLQKIQAAGINPLYADSRSIALPNSTRIEEIIQLDSEAVVQDLNSQQVLEPLYAALDDKGKSLTLWDSCAASGGKSLLAHDLFEDLDLTASDVRPSILHNLQARFKRAGIINYKSFVADVSSPAFSTRSRYDVVICDAPCSGAGTWSRTPEQLYSFQPDKINYYADLQKRIARNASRAVKKGGYFVYITCSVFRKENEEVAQYLKENAGIQLESLHYFKGYASKADTLFAALFRAL